MSAKPPKRPRDPNQLAKLMVDIAVGEAQDLAKASLIEGEAEILGRIGGLKGGKARAVVLNPSRRSEIAKAAAAARWKRQNDESD